MEDEFLRNAKPPVRPAFAEALDEELQQLPRRNSLLQRLRARPLILGIAILLVGVTGVAAAQAIQYFWERRGGFWVHEGDATCQWIHYTSPQRHTSTQPPERVPLSEALAQLDYEVTLPTWVPDGFELVDPVRPPSTPQSEVIIYYWEKAGEGSIVLAVAKSDYTPQRIAPKGSLEIVDINGRETLLVRGRCAFPDPTEVAGLPDSTAFRTEWDDTGASLTWRSGEVVYWLFVTGPYATAEDLIRMAESIP